MNLENLSPLTNLENLQIGQEEFATQGTSDMEY
jgi:hypothetical protein